jgi:hypothetical protein
MFSSAKFLSPIATGGFPAPGALELLDAELLDAVVLDVVDEELLPHAASPTVKANAAEIPPT